MTPERYEQVFQIIRAVRRMPSQQRDAFIASVCGTDEALRSEVDSLLEHCEPTRKTGSGWQRLDEGTVLGGRYVVETFLGEGGAGSVYRASDLTSGDTVAVKIPCVEANVREAALNALEREVRAVARLSHPHILRVFGVTADPVVGPFLTMEYAEGTTLTEAIDRAGHLGFGDAAAVMLPVCSAVHAAHEAGVIHRDLKPQNVLLATRETGMHPLVLDFGTARFQASTTLERGLRSLSGVMVGTPHFMAPEQCEGREADARTDVYALGCMLYTAVAGRPPFPGTSVGVVLMMHLSVAAEPLSKIVTDVPKVLDEVVARALAKDPADRQQSARELGEAIAAGCAGVSPA